MNWSYVAGFIDGDGCISFNRHERARIIISNTNREVLESIQEFIGNGKIYTKTQSRGSFSSSKPLYQLTYTKYAEVLDILKEIVDFLIVKRSQAEKAIEAMVNKPLYSSEKTALKVPYSYEEFCKETNLSKYKLKVDI